MKGWFDTVFRPGNKLGVFVSRMKYWSFCSGSVTGTEYSWLFKTGASPRPGDTQTVLSLSSYHPSLSVSFARFSLYIYTKIVLGGIHLILQLECHRQWPLHTFIWELFKLEIVVGFCHPVQLNLHHTGSLNLLTAPTRANSMLNQRLWRRPNIEPVLSLKLQMLPRLLGDVFQLGNSF